MGVLRLRLSVSGVRVRSTCSQSPPRTIISAAARRCAESTARRWVFPDVQGTVGIDAYFVIAPPL